jgi:uncharacterized protein YjbI with pentapeptide repeats
MIKYPIIHRQTGQVLFEADIEPLYCDNTRKKRLAVEWAIKRKEILIGANLSKADLSGLNLSGLNLSDASLWRANFIGADMRGTNMTDAIVTGAVFYGAYMRGAILDGHDLNRPEFDGAIF